MLCKPPQVLVLALNGRHVADECHNDPNSHRADTDPSEPVRQRGMETSTADCNRSHPRSHQKWTPHVVLLCCYELVII